MSSVKVSGNVSGTGVFEIAAPNSNTNRTLTLPDATGTVVTANGSNQLVAPASGILFADATTQTTAAVAAPADVQTFNSTATWTKPTAGQTMARIQIWGAGGGGGRSGGAGTTAGGGGAYNEVTVPLSYLASSITVTVGAGGTGATANGNGSVGGTSSITLSTAWNGVTTWAAYGGGGGGSGSLFGGGGGGTLSAGGSNTGVGGNPKILLGSLYISVCVGSLPFYAGYFGLAGNGTAPAISPAGVYHGGAGSGNSGGDSYWGGGGGTKTGGVAGVSMFGGSGGVNAVGTAPAGGGGCGAANVNGSNGAAGRVIITSY